MTERDWAAVFSQVGERGVLVIATLAFALLVLRVAHRTIRSMQQAGNLSPTMAIRLRLLLRWAFLSAIGLIVLQQIGVFHQAWAVLSAALATLAVGFVATWSVLSNATTAAVVLLYRPFRVGDEIEIVDTDGDPVIQGRVVDLNLMYTTLLQDDTAAVRIPNNLFLQKLVRVRRDGLAPDASQDRLGPFFDSAQS